MAEWSKRVGFGPDTENRVVSFYFTPQEIDLLSLAIEKAALGEEDVVFTPSEGILLYRLKSVLDSGADWAEGESE